MNYYRRLEISTLFAFAWVALPLVPAWGQAIPLTIRDTGTNILISWPREVTNVGLEASPQATPDGGWRKILAPPLPLGTENTLTQAAGSAAQFYRLRALGTAAPALSGLTAPLSLGWDDSGVVQFQFSDPDADLLYLEVTRSNYTGVLTKRFSPDLLGMKGTNGTVSFHLSGSELAFDNNVFSLRLRDWGGHFSAPLSFSISLTAAPPQGTSPVIEQFAAVPARWNRPSGSRDQLNCGLVLGFSDKDGDIARLRLRVTTPVGQQSATEFDAVRAGVAGTGGTVTNLMVSFGVNDPYGTYKIEASLLDRAGHASAPLSATLDLTAIGGAAPLRISSFSPTSGRPGTQVVIQGSGFDAATNNNDVSVSTVTAEVVATAANSLTIIIPEVRGPGRIIVRNANGHATSDAIFMVPPEVVLSPTNQLVPVKATVQFEAKLRSVGDEQLIWTVNDIPGGNSSIGSISPSGLYTAPAQIPAVAEVRVIARVAATPAVSGEAVVNIVPPDSGAGRALILAASGGTVRARDDRVSIAVPPGALQADTTLTIETLDGTSLPSAIPGRRVLGAASFGPTGLIFLKPSTITLPLVRAYPAGTRLTLRFYQPENGGYLQETGEAVVASGGARATAEIGHFTIAVVDDAAPSSPPSTEPILTSLETDAGTSSLLEGMRVPVRIAGEGLTDDLTPQVFTADGHPTDDVRCDTLYVMRTNAALTLLVQTISGADSGRRDYELRLVRPNGVFGRMAFGVDCLPELRVGAGETRELRGEHTYSEAVIDGTLKVPSPDTTSGPLRLIVTGPVTVNGTVDGSGAKGADAVTTQGGAAGAQGGRGGLGRDNGGCRIDLIGGLGISYSDEDDCAGEEYHGGDANEVGELRRERLGYGGLNGKSIGLLRTIVDAIEQAALCIGSLGADTWSCVRTVEGVREIADDIGELATDGPSGRKGLRGMPGAEHGGGGGGGGGQLDLADFTILGIGVSATVQGGGGGAGGDGGHDVAIVTPQRLEVNGTVTAKGGDGGNGSASPDVSFSIAGLFDIDVDLSLFTGFFGGGGGAGSAGYIKLLSGTEVAPSTATAGHIVSSGGKGGLGGVLETEVNGEHFQMTFRSSHADDGFRRASDVRGPRFEPRVLCSRITDAAFLVVTSTAPALRTSMVTVKGEQPGQERTFTSTLRADGREELRLLLFLGFNTIRVSSEEMLNPRLLVLGRDSDRDGLTDAEETALGTDPNLPDTDLDELQDGDELLAGTNPLDPDTDADGLLDGREVLAMGTSPLNPDSDSDGFTDSAENLLGSNPLDPGSVPMRIPPHLLIADASFSEGPATLTLIHPYTGDIGLLTRPNGGEHFGLAFDSIPNINICQHTNLVTHDPLRATTLPLGRPHLTNGEPVVCGELAYNPTNDFFYAQEHSALPGFLPTGQLLRIDPLDASVVRVGIPGAALNALAFAGDGVLYGILPGAAGSDRLVRLDCETGAVAQELGPIGSSPITGLAVSATGLFYASQPVSDKKSRLLQLDRATGVGSELCRVRRAVFQIASPTAWGTSPLISINANQSATGNGLSAYPLISDDGSYIAFLSAASDLVGLSDTNRAYDVFLRDLNNLTTELVSVNTAGTSSGNPPYSQSLALAMSGDARYIAFVSMATNLDNVSPPLAFRMHRRDRSAMKTEVVSDDLNIGEIGQAMATMSTNGQFISYREWGKTAPKMQTARCLVRDMSAPAPQLVCTSCWQSVVSPDGRYVAFTSLDTNITRYGDVFVMAVATGAIVPVSLNLAGTGLGNGGSSSACFSGDGRYVGFISGATDLVSNVDTNGLLDVFVRDLQAGTTMLVSAGLDGTAVGTDGAWISISRDGRYVAFMSSSTNLVSGLVDSNSKSDVFVRDLQTGTSLLASADNSGAPLGGFSFAMSADGHRVAFNTTMYIYLRDLTSGTTTILTGDYRNRPIAASGGHLTISADGSVAAFASPATNLVRLPDRNKDSDIFFRRVSR